jgi:hypothetical protein
MAGASLFAGRDLAKAADEPVIVPTTERGSREIRKAMVEDICAIVERSVNRALRPLAKIA